MRRSWVEVAPPAVDAISLALAKQHCRIEADDSSQDNVLPFYIASAVSVVESRSRRALIRRQYRMLLDDEPGSDVLKFPVSPLVSVDSFEYIDDLTGSFTPWTGGNYTVETAAEPGYLRLGLGIIWPIVTLNVTSPYRVLFTAGLTTETDAARPGLIVAALFLVAHWYSRREPVNVGAQAWEIPDTFDLVIAPHVILDATAV